jgi:hypothetical protein
MDRNTTSSAPANPPEGAEPKKSDRAPDPRGQDDEPPTTPRDRGGASDVGRTMGGGNLGHHKEP